MDACSIVSLFYFTLILIRQYTIFGIMYNALEVP